MHKAAPACYCAHCACASWVCGLLYHYASSMRDESSPDSTRHQRVQLAPPPPVPNVVPPHPPPAPRADGEMPPPSPPPPTPPPPPPPLPPPRLKPLKSMPTATPGAVAVRAAPPSARRCRRRCSAQQLQAMHAVMGSHEPRALQLGGGQRRRKGGRPPEAMPANAFVQPR